MSLVRGIRHVSMKCSAKKSSFSAQNRVFCRLCRCFMPAGGFSILNSQNHSNEQHNT